MGTVRMTPAQTAPARLRQAAAHIEEGHTWPPTSCTAILAAYAGTLGDGSPFLSLKDIPANGVQIANDYARLFAPCEHRDAHGQWLRDARQTTGWEPWEFREWRATALCLAAAMAETGDLGGWLTEANRLRALLA